MTGLHVYRCDAVSMEVPQIERGFPVHHVTSTNPNVCMQMRRFTLSVVRTFMDTSDLHMYGYSSTFTSACPVRRLAHTATESKSINI